LGFAVSSHWLYGRIPESLDMGLEGAGDECGIAHIGGAESIRLDDRSPR
jgi:hypothetical protein